MIIAFERQGSTQYLIKCQNGGGFIETDPFEIEESIQFLKPTQPFIEVLVEVLRQEPQIVRIIRDLDQIEQFNGFEDLFCQFGSVCKQPKRPDEKFCPSHLGLKCANCGEEAVRYCRIIGNGLDCHDVLCETCNDYEEFVPIEASVAQCYGEMNFDLPVLNIGKIAHFHAKEHECSERKEKLEGPQVVIGDVEYWRHVAVGGLSIKTEQNRGGIKIHGWLDLDWNVKENGEFELLGTTGKVVAKTQQDLEDLWA